MKKIIPLALFMCVLMVVSGWSISWFMQARSVQSNIENAMVQLDPTLGSMKAASVSTSGFPFKMIITVTNPDLTLHMKPLLMRAHKVSMAAAGNSAGVLTTPTYPESTLHYALTGSITLSLNAMSDELHVRYAGTDAQQLSQANSSLSLATEYNGDNHCEIKLLRTFAAVFNQAWDMQKFFTAPALLEHLRELRCEFPGSITTNTTNNQIISSLASASVMITNVQGQSQTQSNINIALKDYEIMPAGDEAINQIRRALTPVDEAFVPISMSLYGKQSLLMELITELPQDLQLNNNVPFKIEMKQLKFSSAGNSTEGNFTLSSTPQGKEQQGKFSLYFSSEFAPRQTDIARANMGQYLREALKNDNITITNPANSAELEAALFEALPNVTQLGKITQNIDIHFAGNKEKRTGNVDIPALEISTRDYGISGNGKATMAEGEMLPAAHLELTCKNCVAMIDVMSAYLARVEKAAVLLSPENAGNIAPTVAQTQGIKQLLQAVGKPPAAAPNDLQFIVESNAGAVDINGKTLPELMMLVQQYLQQ